MANKYLEKLSSWKDYMLNAGKKMENVINHNTYFHADAGRLYAEEMARQGTWHRGGSTQRHTETHKQIGKLFRDEIKDFHTASKIKMGLAAGVAGGVAGGVGYNVGKKKTS